MQSGIRERSRLAYEPYEEQLVVALVNLSGNQGERLIVWSVPAVESGEKRRSPLAGEGREALCQLVERDEASDTASGNLSPPETAG